MKKLFTLIVAAFMAVSVNAQTETPLVLGGDWNAGFAGDADVYDFTINKQYGAAEFACNVNSADYPKYILEFEEPLPANFQVNYTWKTSAMQLLPTEELWVMEQPRSLNFFSSRSILTSWA